MHPRHTDIARSYLGAVAGMGEPHPVLQRDQVNRGLHNEDTIQTCEKMIATHFDDRTKYILTFSKNRNALYCIYIELDYF